ncbi:MAG: diguanylate cyclase [Nitrospirota bacterium]
MANKILFVVCEHYVREAQAAIEAEQLDDAVVIGFPARCGRPPLTTEELTAKINALGNIDQVEVFGASCLTGIADFTSQDYKVHVHKRDQCFTLVADLSLINYCLKKGAYLATPGWLANWRTNIERLGLNQETASEMFAETTTGIVMLETGVNGHNPEHVKEFAEYVHRPFEIIHTGVSVLRLLFGKIALVRQMELQRKEAAKEIKEIRKQAATHAMAIDLLSNLAKIVTETEAVHAMLDVYTFLFAPQRLCYLSFQDGVPNKLWLKPEGLIDEAEQEALKEKLDALQENSGYTESGKGFYLRIVRRGEIRGVIALEDIALPEYLDQYLNLAFSIVDICELPIQNARKYEKLVRTQEMLRKANEDLYRLSTTDALTGIANRRAYDEYLEVEWKRMLRNNTPLSLIICDIDYFKKYNDRYGHKKGDICLHTVAQIIRKIALRPGDFVARYGGEEFVVVLPNTPTEGAFHLAEKIRMAVVQYNIPHEGSEIAPSVTLSLGIAELKPPFDAELTCTTLFRMADKALYQAKNEGRNRTIVWKGQAE